MPLWIMTMALLVLVAALGVKARSFDTTIAIIVRPSGVAPISSTLTNREARSKRRASSTASAYGAVWFQSDFSPVVSRSRRASLVLAVSEAAALAAAGSKAECGARASWARPTAAKTHAHEIKRTIMPNLRTRVACIERTESIRMTGRFEFLFNAGQLENLPAVYYGSARVRPADVAALQRVVYQKFPPVTVVNVADVMQIVEDVVQRIAAVIRFISGFTILAGAVMVASSVAGTRFRRMREVVTLKTLGATRRRIAWIFSVEFLALGTVAGLMGSLLAGGFAALVLKRLLQIDFHPALLTHALAVAIAALVATVAGWGASFRILGRKPLEILRDE